MSNAYVNYYLNQAGSGLSAFEGVRFQRGNGFFGRLLSGAILPALRFLGRKALSTGVNVGMDVLDGNNVKESIKKRSKTAAKDVANAALHRAQRFVQTGRGQFDGETRAALMSTLPPSKGKKRKRNQSKSINGRKRRQLVRSVKRARKPVKKRSIRKKRPVKKRAKSTHYNFDFLS